MAYDLKRCGALMGEASEFGRKLKGARLLTAEVLYYMPDHPTLLQTFMWQTIDEAPRFPRLTQFLDHWRREIEAVIHSVRIAQGELVAPSEWRNAKGIVRLN